MRQVWLNRQGIGLAIATMIFEPYTSRAVSITLYCVLVVFKLGVITDYEMLTLSSENLKEYDRRYQYTILNRENLLVRYLQKVDIVTFMKYTDFSTVFILLSVAFLWLLLSSLTLIAFNKFKKFTTEKPDHRPEQPFYFKLVTAMVYNYELIFLYILRVCIESMTCIRYPVEVKYNDSENDLTLTTEQRAESDKTVEQYMRACGLNKSIPCLQLGHVLIGLVCSVMLLCNFWIKFVALQVLNHSPEPKILHSMYGWMDLCHTAIFVTILIIKSVILNSAAPNQYSTDYFYWACLCLLLVSLSLHTFFPPYYDRLVNRIRSIELLLMLLCVSTVLLIRHTDLHLVHDTTSLIVTLCFAFTALLRVCINIDRHIDDIAAVKQSSQYDVKDICKVAYRGFQYVYRSLGSDDAGRSELQDLVYFLNLKRAKDRDIYLRGIQLGTIAMSPLLERLKGNHQKNQSVIKDNKIGKEFHKSALEMARQESMQRDIDSDLQDASISEKDKASSKVQVIHKNSTVEIKVSEHLAKDENIWKASKTISRGKRTENDSDFGLIKKRSTIIKQPIKEATNNLYNLVAVNKPGHRRTETGVPNIEGTLPADYEFTSDLENKYLILDKFSEVKGSNMRFIMFLIRDLVEEKLNKLIVAPSTTLSKIRTLLNLSVSLSLNLLGNVPLACIKLHQVQQLFKRNKTKTSETHKTFSITKKLPTSDSLRIEILRSYISLVLRHNSQTGELVLQSIRRELTTSDKTENKLQLYKMIDFYNRYDRCKETVVKAAEIKRKLLLEMAEKREADYKKVFEASSKFYAEMNKVTEDLNYLESKVSVEFTALKFVEGHFLIHLLQDIKRGKGVLEKAVKRTIQLNYNNVKYDSRDARKAFEKVVISVSGEYLDFHTIVNATANCKLYLGYTSDCLVDKDLSLLIPSPLKECHAKMMNYKQSIGTVFEYKESIPIVALDVDDLAVLCRLSARINFQLQKGLQFIGFLDFSTLKDSDHYFLVNKAGIVTNTNIRAYRYLEPNTSLTVYNSEFGGILGDLNRVADFIVHHDDMTPADLVNDPRVYTHSKMYYQQCTGSEISIIDRRKKSRKIQYLVNDHYYGRISSFMRCVFFYPGKAIMSQTALSKFILGEMLDKMQIKSSRTFFEQTEYGLLPSEGDDRESVSLASVNNKDAFRIASYLTAENRRQPRVEAILNVIQGNISLLEAVGELSVLRQIFAEEKDTPLNMNESVSDLTPKEEFVPIGSYASKPSGDDSSPKSRGEKAQKFVLRLNITFKEHNRNVMKESFLELYKFRGVLLKRLAAVKLQNMAKHLLNLKNENNQVSLNLYGNFDNQASKERISRILNHKLNYRPINLKTALLALVVIVSVILQFVLGFLKYDFDLMITREVRYKMLSVDLNSWSYWASSNLLLVVDTTRSVYEGSLDDSAYAYWSGSQVKIANTALKGEMLGMLQSSVLRYRYIMSNLSMTYFFDESRYTEQKELSLWSPGHVNWENPPSKVQWAERRLKFSEALSFMQPAINLYIKRNDSTFNYSRIGSNRDMDLLAEFLRKNLVNDLLVAIDSDFYDLAAYFRSICAFNTVIVRYGELTEFVVLATAALIVLGVLIKTRYQMAKFYDLMFDIKVGLSLIRSKMYGWKQTCLMRSHCILAKSAITN